MSGDQFKIKLAANLSANEQTRQIWQCIHLDIMFHTFGHLSWCQFWGKSFLKVMHYSIPFLPNKSNFALHYITSAVHFLIWACLFTFNIIFNNVAYFWSHPHHTPFNRTLGCAWYSPGSAERETSVCEIKWAESLEPCPLPSVSLLSQAMNGRRARETDSTRDSHTHTQGREAVRLFWQTECVCDGVSMALALAAVCEVWAGLSHV